MDPYFDLVIYILINSKVLSSNKEARRLIIDLNKTIKSLDNEQRNISLLNLHYFKYLFGYKNQNVDNDLFAISDASITEKISENDISFLVKYGIYLLSKGSCQERMNLPNLQRDQNVVMILPQIEAMDYGIGSYINAFKRNSKNNPFNLYLIYIKNEYKEFEVIIEDLGLIIYHIPLFNFYSVNSRESMNNSVNSISFLIEREICNLPNLIIQINYPSVLQYVKQMITKFSFQLVSVVHFFNWQMILDGNKNRFTDIWSKRNRKEELPQLERTVINACLLEMETYSISDSVIILNKFSEDILIDFYNIPSSKISLVRNGIFDDMPVKVYKQRLRNKFFFEEEEKIIVFSGRLTKQKGVAELIVAFQKLLRIEPRAKLIILGSGKREAYVDLCKDVWNKIIFTGHVSEATVRDFYIIADVFVIPSLYDTCPYSALEGMMNKLPIVATDSVGLDELFIDDHNASISKVVTKEDGEIVIDTVDLCDRILELLRNEAKAIRLGENAHLTMIENHDVEKMAYNYHLHFSSRTNYWPEDII